MYDLPQAPPKQHIQFLSKQKTSAPFGSIIKFPPNGGKTENYNELACSEQDKANIYELITLMAENGKLSLLLKQSYLKNLGAQINHVHPLKFLSTVFTNCKLKECMADIFDDYFKRNGFMDGFGASMTREADKNKLGVFLNEFAAEVMISADTMRPYFQGRDWEGLVRYMMQQ